MVKHKSLKSLLMVSVVALTLGAAGSVGNLVNNQPQVHASSFKASDYPEIQDTLQSMNSNQLFMASSMIRGTVESWGATSDGSAQILLQDNAGNEFLICPNSNKGLKHVAVGKTVTAYGSNFNKQKINDSQMNVGIDPSYYGNTVINMISIDKATVE